MATNTTATATTHTGNGSTNNFAISFSFLSNAEIDVTVAGVLKTLDTHYTISGSTITFTSGNTPANGAAIKFQRDTNISAKKVDFQDGSVLTETDLDTNSDQVLFAQQEITDKLSGIEEGATGDQTAAEIRTLVESATDSNVFTDADHTKLNGIEASATADQTDAEIKTAYENNSNTNAFTDAEKTKLSGIETSATANQTDEEIQDIVGAMLTGNTESGITVTYQDADGTIDFSVASQTDENFTTADHNKLDGIESGATADQTVTEIKSLIAGSPLDSSHLAANSVTTSEIADAELTTLAGMQSATASKLADATALTSDIADLNQLDGMAKQTTITDDDTKFPTSGAIVDYVAAQIAPIGGLEVIATDAAFPNTQPSAGVVISIADAGGLVVNGSGTSTTARTVGGSTVTINNINSSFNSSTITAGVGFLVSSTGSGQIYNFHKAVIRDQDILSISSDINDFGNRYRVGSSNPTSSLDAGDLFYNTTLQKLLVYNATSSAWEESQGIGNYFLTSFNESVDGSRQDFTITNAPPVAQQILLSINGVIQKPNAGTSTPSEGFALSGSTIKLAAAPASNSDIFTVVMGSEVNIGTPSNNTVSTAILQNGSVTTAKLANDSVTGDKLSNNLDIPDNNKIRFGTGNDLEISHDGSHSVIKNNTGNLYAVSDASIILQAATGGDAYLQGIKSGAVELYYSGSKKLETTSSGVDVTGEIDIERGGSSGTALNVNTTASSGATRIKFNESGTTKGQVVYSHDNDQIELAGDSGNGAAVIVNFSENAIKAISNGAVELYYDGSSSPKLETTASGATVTGNIAVTGTVDGRDVAADGSKLDDLVSIKDYGAKGDGSTNDTTAFSNALASEKGIYIPAGTYIINSTLSVTNKNVTMIGAGERLSIIRFTGGTDGLQWNETTSQSNGGPVHSLILEKLAFETNVTMSGSPVNASCTSPLGTITSAVSMENIVANMTPLSSGGWTNGFRFNNIRNSNIIECIFNGTNNTSTYGFKFTGQCLDTKAERCQAAGLIAGSGQGFIVEGTSEGVQIISALVIAAKIGVDHVTTNMEPYLSVIGCHFNTIEFGIRMSKGQQSIISNNLFYANTESAYATVDYVGVNLNANADNKFNNISDNIFHALGRANTQDDIGVRFQHGDNNVIADNVFIGLNTGIQIQAAATNTTLSDNRYNQVLNPELQEDTTTVSLRADGNRYMITAHGNKDVQLELKSGSDGLKLSNFSDGSAGIESTNNSDIKFFTNGQKMQISPNGNIGAPNGSNIHNASDSRLKQNVVNLDKGLSAINSLRPVSFNWIDGFCDEEKNTLYGFLAQEVQAVDSNLIDKFGIDGKVQIGETIIEDTLRVNEKFITPILVKALQELSAKVEVLESKITTLENN